MGSTNIASHFNLAIAPNFPRKLVVWLLIGVFLSIFLLGILIGGYVNKSHKASQRLTAKLLVQGYAQRVQERLQTAMISTYVLGAAVKQTGGVPPNFSTLAAELIGLFPSVSALQLAPDGVIREIYPMDGNQRAIGHDLLADRSRNREAVAAISMQQLTLAGPFNLIQGGVGAVGRRPLFLVNERNESYFWGFANALVLLPQLLDSAGIDGLQKSGFEFELWRVDPDTEQRHVFAKGGEGPLVVPIEHVITVHNGRWIFSVAPTGGWVDHFSLIELIGYSLLVAIMVTQLAYFAIRALARSIISPLA